MRDNLEITKPQPATEQALNRILMNKASTVSYESPDINF